MAEEEKVEVTKPKLSDYDEKFLQDYLIKLLGDHALTLEQVQEGNYPDRLVDDVDAIIAEIERLKDMLLSGIPLQQIPEFNTLYPGGRYPWTTPEDFQDVVYDPYQGVLQTGGYLPNLSPEGTTWEDWDVQDYSTTPPTYELDTQTIQYLASLGVTAEAFDMTKEEFAQWINTQDPEDVSQAILDLAEYYSVDLPDYDPDYWSNLIGNLRRNVGTVLDAYYYDWEGQLPEIESRLSDWETAQQQAIDAYNAYIEANFEEDTWDYYKALFNPIWSDWVTGETDVFHGKPVENLGVYEDWWTTITDAEYKAQLADYQRQIEEAQQAYDDAEWSYNYSLDKIREAGGWIPGDPALEGWMNYEDDFENQRVYVEMESGEDTWLSYDELMGGFAGTYIAMIKARQTAESDLVEMQNRLEDFMGEETQGTSPWEDYFGNIDWEDWEDQYPPPGTGGGGTTGEGLSRVATPPRARWLLY